MDFKTKGKEGTNAKGQKKGNAKLGKVNKKRPGNEKKDDADDVSKNFPNFSILNQEERLAFFEALSAARKNIEKRGLPTRERFGTVHDQYLQYFSRDDKAETIPKKPESAPSASRSPAPKRKIPQDPKPTTPDSPRQRLARTPEPASPVKKTPKPPQKNPRPESEPNDFCESVIKRDTDQMIQMYLDKKKRIEEEWKKSAQAKTPPAKPKTRETIRPPSGRPPSRREDPKPKTPSKQALASNTTRVPTERKELVRNLKEDHGNVLSKNPQEKDDIPSLDEVPKSYKGGKTTPACPAMQNLQHRKQQQQQQQQKNLRVKVTLTSGDNKRLNRTKSQVLKDSLKKGSGGKSKSLESVVCTDVPKQSKIPILKKAPHERNDCCEIKTERRPVKKNVCEESVARRAAEAKKAEAPVKEKTLTIKEEPEKREEVCRRREEACKEKTKEKKKERKLSGECEGSVIGDAASDLEEAREELEKVRREKEQSLKDKKKAVKEKVKVVKEKEKEVKEKQKALAEAAKKEKELMRKKRKEEWKKRHHRETGKKSRSKEEDCMELKVVGVRVCQEETNKQVEKKKSECRKEELTAYAASQEKELACKEKEEECKEREEECKEREEECKEKEDECKEKEEECKEKEDEWKEKEKECEEKEDEWKEKEKECEEKEDEWKEKEKECEERELLIMAASQEKEDKFEEKIACGDGHQTTDCVQKEQEEEEDEKDEEEGKKEESKESSSAEKEQPPWQQSSKCQTVQEACQQLSAGDSPEPKTSKESSGLAHREAFSSLVGGEYVVKAATHSTKSLAGVSLLEQRREETWQAQEMAPTYTTGKVVVVDDNVIKRIKDLVQYLDKKAHSKENLQSDYVRLVLSYTEYLMKVTESLIPAKKPKKGQEVLSTYAAPQVRLKFGDGDKTPKEESKKVRIPHSISEEELQRQMLPGPSGIQKKEDSRRKKSTYDFDLSDSESSTSEDENRTLTPSAFKKTGIPMTKIRLLQDLLNGRAKFEEGSINDFKIVHIPEGEYVPPEKPSKEEAKEISEADVDQGQKAVRMKFLRNLAKLCNCGKKQIEEDAILENLKGEAVRVDTAEPHKDSASATINDSTMEVLKAAERKKIIEKYLKREQS